MISAVTMLVMMAVVRAVNMLVMIENCIFSIENRLFLLGECCQMVSAVNLLVILSTACTTQLEAASSYAAMMATAPSSITLQWNSCSKIATFWCSGPGLDIP